jgi:hypothetical protein
MSNSKKLLKLSVEEISFIILFSLLLCMFEIFHNKYIKIKAQNQTLLAAMREYSSPIKMTERQREKH